MIVLENLTHRFVRPNVLDVKLGTQLYDEFATPQKQERMRQGALATTSATTGIRLTGFQVRQHFSPVRSIEAWKARGFRYPSGAQLSQRYRRPTDPSPQPANLLSRPRHNLAELG